jgi:predicted nucleotidyltransferase
MVDHGLSKAHVSMIAEVLAPFAPHIDSVGLFGSRATGTQKPGSDIDLVLYGPLTEAMVDRLWTRFTESLLPFSVDVVAYSCIQWPALQRHIDTVMLPLLSQQDLIRLGRKAA